MLNLDQVRVVDPVITQLAQGYKNAEGVASFLAPVVFVNARAGKVLVFGKEAFADLDLVRAPGANIQKVNAHFTTRAFALRQEAISWTITEEAAMEARTGAAQLDLRRYASMDAAARLMQSWEIQVANEVTNSGQYELSCIYTPTASEKWDAATSDVEIQIDDAREAVRAQIGTYPNKMVLSPEAYNALKRNKRIRDWATRGTIVNERVLANIFGLDEVRVARRLKLNPNTGALENIYSKNAVLFYQPGAASDGFMPAVGAQYGKPAFAYTYALQGYPVSTPERFKPENRTFCGDMIVERSIELVGLGENQLVGSAFYFDSVVD